MLESVNSFAVNQVPSSEWVPISMEAEDDNDGSDPGVEEEDEEEEDQLEDEGEPVESDIGKVDSRYVFCLCQTEYAY